MVNYVLYNVNSQNNKSSYENVHKNLVAVTTNRETCLEYTGNAEGNMGVNSGGYEVAEADAKETKGQFLADIERISGVGNTEGTNKPMSYADVYNATIKSLRNELEKNRIPSTQGTKQTNATVNYLTNKNIKNAYKDRETKPNKHNKLTKLPTKMSIKMKNSLNDTSIAQRNNTDMLTAFKNNHIHNH